MSNQGTNVMATDRKHLSRSMKKMGASTTFSELQEDSMKAKGGDVEAKCGNDWAQLHVKKEITYAKF